MDVHRSVGMPGSAWIPSGARGSSAVRHEPAKAKSEEEEKLAKACRDFEAIFIEEMLKAARASVPKDGLFSSESEEMMWGMLNSQLAQEMASSSGIGLAEFIQRDVERKQVQVKPNAHR